MIECSQSQSVNTYKRVVVSGHIPELLGTWGLSTIILGKSVSQERQAKGKKFVWIGQQFREGSCGGVGGGGMNKRREQGK
jgi:hypothetical protein